MEVLLTGNIAFVTQRFVETVFPDDHVLIAKLPGYDMPEQSLHSAEVDGKEILEQLVQTYSFERVVFFSDYISPHNVQSGEMEWLRRVLQYCFKQKTQMIYVTGPEALYEQETGKSVVARSAVNLCRQYAQTGKIEIKVVKSPYIYTIEPIKQPFMSLFERARDGVLTLDEQPDQPLEYLCDDDLAVLLYRLYDNWTPTYEEFQIPEVFGHTVSDLADTLKSLQPNLKVVYGKDQPQPLPQTDQELRKRFYWFPKHDLLRDMPLLYENWKAVDKPKEKWHKRLVHKLMGGSKWIIGLEILILFVISEELTELDYGMVQFRTVDFRLLFVVIIATIHGMTPGVIAAVLATAALMAANAAEGVSWVSMFYEPTNWLAFIAYFIAGAICGYVKLRNKENIRFTQEENLLLRQRTAFIRSLYQDTLEDKQSYRRQLLGRRDSFGRIYSIIRELDSLEPDVLFTKAVQVIEEVLDNHTVSIYTFDTNQTYARLEVSSADIAEKAPRSLRMNDYQNVTQAVIDQGIWVNRELNPNLPMYAAAVRQEEKMLVLITVMEANTEQMNLYTQNLFRILCGLLEAALLRAYEYQRLAREESYVEDTRLLKLDAFNEILRVSWDMQERKIASHVLLRVDTHGDSAQQVNERLIRRVRTNDAAGWGTDGTCYLLLKQAKENNLSMILERLNESGYEMQVVTPEEEQEILHITEDSLQ